MYTIYTTTLISENCSKGMTPSNCPLRKYVNSEKELFHASVNETHLVPNKNDRETFIQMYDTKCMQFVKNARMKTKRQNKRYFYDYHLQCKFAD